MPGPLLAFREPDIIDPATILCPIKSMVGTVKPRGHGLARHELRHTDRHGRRNSYITIVKFLSSNSIQHPLSETLAQFLASSLK
jgi:hypothetical protein